MNTQDILVVLTSVIISLQATLVVIGVIALRRGPLRKGKKS